MQIIRRFSMALSIGGLVVMFGSAVGCSSGDDECGDDQSTCFQPIPDADGDGCPADRTPSDLPGCQAGWVCCAPLDN